MVTAFNFYGRKYPNLIPSTYFTWYIQIEGDHIESLFKNKIRWKSWTSGINGTKREAIIPSFEYFVENRLKISTNPIFIFLGYALGAK